MKVDIADGYYRVWVRAEDTGTSANARQYACRVVAAKGFRDLHRCTAYLLRLQSIHQRYHRYRPDTTYLPGPLNVMSDDCFRLWHLSDTPLLAHFNATYPQTRSWRLWHPTPEMFSAVTSALRKTRSAPESFLIAPTRRKKRLLSGRPSAKTSVLIHGYKVPSNAPTLYSSSKFLPIAIAPASSLPKVTRSDL
jgi:hypothetical protein